MDLITCHHCGYEWKPRKKTGPPVKCARCQNPLWQSPRPKRSTISRRVDPVKFKPTEVPVAEDEPSFAEEVNAIRDWAKELPPLETPTVHEDPLAARKARVQSLLAGVL